MPTAFTDTSYFCESLCDRAVLSKTNKSPLYFSNVHLYLLQCSSGKDVRIVTVSGPWWWETRTKAAVLSHDTRCCQTPAAEPRTSVWSCLILFYFIMFVSEFTNMLRYTFCDAGCAWTLSNFCSSTRETNPPAIKLHLKPSHTSAATSTCVKESKEQSKANAHPLKTG